MLEITNVTITRFQITLELTLCSFHILDAMTERFEGFFLSEMFTFSPEVEGC